jgi:hypothetical protein
LLKQRPPSSAATMTTRNPGVVGLVDQTRKLQRTRCNVATPHSVLGHGLAQTETLKLCRNHDHKKSHQENRGCGACGPDEEIATSQMQRGHTAQCAETRPCSTATPKLCRNHDHKKSLGLWGLWTRRGNCNGPDAMWPHRTVCWDTALLKQRPPSSAATMTTRNPTKKSRLWGFVDQTRKLQRARYDVAIPHSVLRHGLAQTATPSSAATMTTRNPGVVGLVDQTRKLQRTRCNVAIPHSALRHALLNQRRSSSAATMTTRNPWGCGACGPDEEIATDQMQCGHTAQCGWTRPCSNSDPQALPQP